MFCLFWCKVINVEDGRVVVELELGEEHENPVGTMHGGFVASLMDVVSYCALKATDQSGEVAGLSVDMNITYTSSVFIH
jgi:acyl-coenzyme A thioesterase 13